MILALRVAETHGETFIPCTRAIDIGDGMRSSISSSAPRR